ncbi:MAG TPA: sensor histidine kinase, partial [Flavisolibacter sp.]|nr:sensor histidine kinase [Flavisolibacter sp.]
EHAKTGTGLSSSARHYKKSGEGIDVELSATMVDLGGRRVFLVIAKNVTEKNRQEREITKAIIQAQENERSAIGTELHDNVCQIIASTQLALDMLKPPAAEPAMRWWQHARQNTDLALEEIRTLSHRLAPVFLEDIGLQEAFERLLQSMRAGQPFTTTLLVDPSFAALQPGPELQLHLYRMVQEQLRNIVKYAEARRVTVRLDVRGAMVVLTVEDDGRGFDPGSLSAGIGLRNIAKRAELFFGTMIIESAPGRGCRVRVEIPVPA